MIGGGYATGRELVEFFLPSGPWGGLMAMLLATVIWSVVCALTFLFARATQQPGLPHFLPQPARAVAGSSSRSPTCLFIVLILAVFGAAAGAIGKALFGWPTLVGTLCLMVGIASFAAFGNTSVERLFKWVSFFLYGVYALFVVLALASSAIASWRVSRTPVPTDGWALGRPDLCRLQHRRRGVILPVLRHMRSDRDAVVAGVLAGPLAMIPALAVLHLHGGVLPADRAARRCRRTSCCGGWACRCSICCSS